SATSLISALVTFSLVIGASSMIGSYTERFTVPPLPARQPEARILTTRRKGSTGSELLPR
ncbi:hypothetical protein ACFQ7B_39070, partial [Streptomyces erythrochromogenes]|uniref:hypothetical protein n=1 Tax=Streptomyces erythrochromogenes TaxID=285574 RepID=UPI003698B48D